MISQRLLALVEALIPCVEAARALDSKLALMEQEVNGTVAFAHIYGRAALAAVERVLNEEET